MSCCTPSPIPAEEAERQRGRLLAHEILLASRTLEGGVRQIDIAVPGIHCGGCIQRIETALHELPGVQGARVNFSTKRVSVRWTGEAPPPLVERLDQLGYEAHLFAAEDPGTDKTLTGLVWALAVAGFATMNIMLLSVSVWSGAEPQTRDLFHWISALIALPALVFSGRVFFVSAWRSLRRGQANMDVPISVGVLLAFGMSLYDTINHGPHAYFDASVSLLFFLLIGRTLDHVMRERARATVKGLARMASRGAEVIGADGAAEYLPVEDLRPGMRIALATGERVPVDGQVLEGRSEIDCSLVTGESIARPAMTGSRLDAGTLNLSGPLVMVATATASESFLAEMVRMMEAAEAGRSGYRRLADRVSRLYAPVVHLAALVSFFAWLVLGGDLHHAVTIAVAVLIITCPCALGLAVPMVQVMAARRLFDKGVMVKDGAALERLAEIDHVVFDKTGTLTLGTPTLTNAAAVPPGQLAIAAAIAAHSPHPHARALVGAARGLPASPLVFDSVTDEPGCGLEAVAGADRYRLGRGDWAAGGAAAEGTVLSRNGAPLATFTFAEAVRPDTDAALDDLRRRGLGMEILSGDAPAAVAALARRLRVDAFTAGVRPADKLERIATLHAAGRRVLMVGDGLNDAPALAAADVSIAPATAADVGRNAAGFVFLRPSLDALPFALDVAQRANTLIRQNFVLAIGYNAIALPLAVLGHVTPLVAALAMSLSSVLVVGNAMRLGLRSVARSAPVPAPIAKPYRLEPAE